jgi:surface carbohydrate biosynthesis protein (TIGR04326 family)
VLGDYLEENTIRQMELLQNASKLLNDKVQFLVKPHPVCPIDAEDYPELTLEVTDEPIPMLISHCSMVFTSGVTSAAVDAYCSGKHVVTVLDSAKLNLSPLRGREDVSFVSSPAELGAVVNEMGQMKDIDGQGKDYFYIDHELSRWRELLGNNDQSKKKKV